jgi:phosphonoacetate hydrolase
MVPFILSRTLNTEYALKAQADPRNFDIFEFVLNGIAVK